MKNIKIMQKIGENTYKIQEIEIKLEIRGKVRAKIFFSIEVGAIILAPTLCRSQNSRVQRGPTRPPHTPGMP